MLKLFGVMFSAVAEPPELTVTVWSWLPDVAELKDAISTVWVWFPL